MAMQQLQKIKVQQLAELLQKRTHANTSSPDMEAIEGNPWRIPYESRSHFHTTVSFLSKVIL